MNKQLVIILFFLGSIAYPQSNITVALSLNDCINCTLSIHELRDKLNNPKIRFLLNEELEADSTLVNTRTGLNNFSPREVVYSDSLYNKFAKGVRSTVSLIKDGKLIYTDLLYKLDVDKFVGEYNKAFTTISATGNNVNISKTTSASSFKGAKVAVSATGTRCFNALRKGIMQIQADETLLVYSTQLKRYTYYDGQGNSKDIVADSLWMKMAYQTYYKDKGWQKEYKAMNELILQAPNVLPAIKYGSKEGNKLLFLVDVSFMRVAGDNDVHISKKAFLAEFDIKKNALTNCFYIDSQMLDAKGYYINSNGFTKKDGVYLFALGSTLDPVTDTKFIATYLPNKKSGNILELKEILGANIPENYLKYGLNGNFQSYTFDNKLVCLNFGEYIYDWKNKIKYPVPYTKEETESLATIYDMMIKGGSRITTFFLYDIFDGPGNIYVLYTDPANNLKLINIDKKTKAKVESRIIIENSKLNTYKSNESFRIKNSRQLIYIDNNNCLAYLDIQ